jgi:hypothetical protein
MGVRVQLFSPQENVRQMLWFHRFFVAARDDRFELVPNAPQADPARYLPDLAQVSGWRLTDSPSEVVVVRET